MQEIPRPTFLSSAVFTLVVAILVATVLLYGTVHPPMIALFYVLVVFAALCAIGESWKAGELRVNTSPIQLPLILAAAYAFVQVVPFGSVDIGAGVGAVPRTISQDPFWTLMFGIHALGLSLFLAICLNTLNSARRIQRIAVLITVFGFVYAFFSVIQSFLSPDRIYGVYEVNFAKPFGSFVNRHNFAAYMEMCIAVPLGMLMHGAVARDKRLVFVTTVALMGVALLMSGSRGGMVALGSQVVMLLILSRDRVTGGRMWLKGVFAIVLALCIVLGAAFIGGETSMSRLSETAKSEDFSTKRTQIWDNTLEVIRNGFPFGAGLGAFSVAYAKQDSGSGLERVEQAHNDYLQVLADAGIIGGLIGLFFLSMVFKSGFRAARLEDGARRGVAVGAFVGIFGVLVHSLFDFVLHTTAVSVLFLLLVALLTSSERGHADDAKEKRRPPSDERPDNVAAFAESRRPA